jgi:hypothetical protein
MRSFIAGTYRLISLTELSDLASEIETELNGKSKSFTVY